jgi:hypothetical protein
MSRTQQIVANRSMRYGTRMLQAGDTFEAKARDARLLIAIGRAKPVPQESPVKEVILPTKEQASQIASILGEVPTASLIEALRAEYRQRAGAEPDRRWGIPKLTKEVSALRNAV